MPGQRVRWLARGQRPDAVFGSLRVGGRRSWRAPTASATTASPISATTVSPDSLPGVPREPDGPPASSDASGAGRLTTVRDIVSPVLVSTAATAGSRCGCLERDDVVVVERGRQTSVGGDDPFRGDGQHRAAGAVDQPSPVVVVTGLEDVRDRADMHDLPTKPFDRRRAFVATAGEDDDLARACGGRGEFLGREQCSRPDRPRTVRLDGADGGEGIGRHGVQRCGDPRVVTGGHHHAAGPRRQAQQELGRAALYRFQHFRGCPGRRVDDDGDGQAARGHRRDGGRHSPATDRHRHVVG